MGGGGEQGAELGKSLVRAWLLAAFLERGSRKQGVTSRRDPYTPHYFPFFQIPQILCLFRKQSSIACYSVSLPFVFVLSRPH